MKWINPALGALGCLALAACVVEAPGNSGGAPEGGISQSAGERACRDALVRYHATGNVRIVSSEPYQGGGRFVRGAVGPTGELWQCIAFADGSTGEISYLGAGGTATQLPSSGTATQLPSSPPGRPAVGSEYGLTEFQGARAGQAEMGIRSLGYEPVRSRGLTTWWFNRQTGACAEIVTSQGRYSSVTMLPAQDC